MDGKPEREIPQLPPYSKKLTIRICEGETDILTGNLYSCEKAVLPEPNVVDGGHVVVNEACT